MMRGLAGAAVLTTRQ